jgi:soluble lytic murein transglycosylase
LPSGKPDQDFPTSFQHILRISAFTIDYFYYLAFMRLSILHLIFICVVTAIFVVFVFIVWHGKNGQIKALNKEILTEQAKIAEIEKQGEKVLTYFRISRGLDILSKKKLPKEHKDILAEKLFAISTDYKIDPLLILAVIKHESRGNPYARGVYQTGGASGALGLMQVKYETALEVANSVGVEINSRTDLFVPEKNLMVGTAYLLRLIAKYKNLQYALIAYNVGIGILDEKLKRGAPLPMKYYNIIMKEYKDLAREIFSIES